MIMDIWKNTKIETTTEPKETTQNPLTFRHNKTKNPKQTQTQNPLKKQKEK